jgi:sarcosine oxidase
MADRTLFDVIVIGIGGMGSAACFELARRGLSVLGLERFSLVHDQGSSHGRTRIIRTAYYEHPDYVPLARRSFERWYELERLCGVHLLTQCGCLSIGAPESEVITGVRKAASQHRLSIENLSAKEIRQQFPPLSFSDEYVGVLEHQAGFLYVEECVRAHIEAARQFGATIHAEEPVVSWTAGANEVSVTTAKASYRAAKLVITAGPWAGSLLERHGASLRVMKQCVFWFGAQNDLAFQRDRFPVYFAETPEGYFYGFPVIDGLGHKMARHYGAPELISPDQINRDISAEDEAPPREFLKRHVPLANGPIRLARTCIYTLSPDRHFIIDVHPDHANVVFAAGFSGHGFKFASIVGEILADLSLHGDTNQPIGLFRLGRFLGGNSGPLA